MKDDKFITTNADHSVTIKLEYPIKFEGEEISEITLSRPKVADQLIADKSGDSNAEKELALFATLAKSPQALIEQLDLKDFGKLQKAYKGFLG